MAPFKRVTFAAKRRRMAFLTLVTALCFGMAGGAAAAEYPFLGPVGAPATAFPKPDRPVASIISPIWHSETERDAARETEQIAMLLDMKPGVTIVDITDPYAFLYNLVPALKPGGYVGIIDARADTSRHGTPLALLKCELAAVGYREVAVHSLTGSDAYLAVFSPPATAARPEPADVKTCKAG